MQWVIGHIFAQINLIYDEIHGTKGHGMIERIETNINMIVLTVERLL